MLKFKETCAFANRKDLPDKMALYGVFNETGVLYIGMSWNLKSRFPNHHKLEAFFEMNASFIGYTIFDDIEVLAQKEVEAIKKFKPLLNEKARLYSSPSIERLKGRKPKEFVCDSKVKTKTFNLLWEFIESSKSGLDALKKIQYDTGLTVPWLRTFANNLTNDPSVIKVETLFFYLGGDYGKL